MMNQEIRTGWSVSKMNQEIRTGWSVSNIKQDGVY